MPNQPDIPNIFDPFGNLPPGSTPQKPDLFKGKGGKKKQSFGAAESELFEILHAIGKMGFSPDQFNMLQREISRRLGAQQQQQNIDLRTAATNLDPSVRSAMLARQQNRNLGATSDAQLGLSRLAADRQMQGILMFLQRALANRAFKESKKQGEFNQFLDIGKSIASIIGG